MLLKDSQIINWLIEIQDINAYIEELEYEGDEETLQPNRQERHEIISNFINMLNQRLAPITNSKCESKISESKGVTKSFNIL